MCFGSTLSIDRGSGELQEPGLAIGGAPYEWTPLPEPLEGHPVNENGGIR